MHDTAFHIGTLAMSTYADLETASILEIGAQIVNGSLRASALPTTNYIGIDIEDAEGVDIVALPGEEWPVEDNCFDLVMATSVFEHDSAFWKTFLQMCRKARPGGYIYISAPSNGKVHRYPQDFWRFYPDAGLAMEALAKGEGIDVTLVESFTAERASDEWNDFCAIFRRGPSAEPLPTSFIWERVACANARTWQSADVLNPREKTEDQLLFQSAMDDIEHLQQANAAERSSWVAERDSLARSAAEARLEFEKSQLLLEEVRAELDVVVQARERAENRIAALEHDLQAREHRTAELESHLRQRQEETSQAWSQVEAEQAAKAELARELELQKAEIEQLAHKIREADEWVYKLSDERRQAEKRSLEFESEVEQLRHRIREADEWVYKLSGERQQAEKRSLEIESELRKERELRVSEQSRARAVSRQLKQRTIELEKEHELYLFEQSGSRMLSNELEHLKGAREIDESRLEENHRKITLVVEQLRESEVELAARKEEINLIAAQLSVADEQLERTRRELSSLNCAARESELVARQKERQLQWLRLVNEVLNGSTKGWRNLMPPTWRRRRQLRALSDRGLFDSAAYLERYPDVAAQRLDPLYHYIAHGMVEGRLADITLD